LLATLGAAFAPLPALAADESGSIWNAQFIKLNTGKDDRIFIRLESQQRLTQDATRLGQFILRPDVAYVVNDDLNTGVGYAYFRTESGASPSGVIYEHRAFTEVNYRILNMPGIKIDTRTRLESRQWENIGDHSIPRTFHGAGDDPGRPVRLWPGLFRGTLFQSQRPAEFSRRL